MSIHNGWGYIWGCLAEVRSLKYRTINNMGCLYGSDKRTIFMSQRLIALLQVLAQWFEGRQSCFLDSLTLRTMARPAHEPAAPAAVQDFRPTLQRDAGTLLQAREARPSYSWFHGVGQDRPALPRR